MTDRIRVGVVGTGLVAQVMHLPYLRELSDRFEIAGLCDLSRSRVDAVGEMYGVARRTTDWRELLTWPLDAVMVLISGSHAPIATASMEAGLHVFAEKPLALSVAEGQAMVDTARATGRVLMVGYMKRYDPAYERLAREMTTLGALRHARLTTQESPLDGYVAHYPLQMAADIPGDVIAELQADDAARVRAALGDVDPSVARVYRDWILDSMIHELNAARGLLGDPDRVEFARIRESGITAVLRFGGLECVASWVDLPGIARYRQTWEFDGVDRRAVLEFPSPFLRSAVTELTFEDGAPGSPASSHTTHIDGFDEAFKRELVELHAAVTEGRPPRTTGEDALRDLALSTAIVSAHVEGRPIDDPTTHARTPHTPQGGTRS
jgi:predicted dehydrogenase